MNRHRPFPRPLLACVVVAGMALLISACGGSDKPPASSGSATGSGSGIQAAYHYSACMREHGVSGFGDPHVQTGANSTAIGFHVDPAITGSPHFKSAQRACSHILPAPTNGPDAAQRRAHTQAVLAFAGCMRRHGFPKFPDPNGQGQLTPAMLSRAGIDLQQPAIRPAALGCVSVTHGAISRADVNRALARGAGTTAQSSGGG